MDNCQGACDSKECCDGGIVINITLNIREVHVIHEDQCTYVDNVYMDTDEGMDMDINLDLEE